VHEFSIVQSLLELCQDEAKKHNGEKVTKVEVKIGVLSGVEPHLLEVAFETFKENSICAEAEFFMQIQPLKIRCKNCDSENELKPKQYSCPICESSDVDVIDGEDMYLMRLELN
jgi:hydrogenase nickel incorporation protein HypA/HybF